MDPDRVRAYLQVACAGLGFDIGEVWWTADQNGSSTVAAIGMFFDQQFFVGISIVFPAISENRVDAKCDKFLKWIEDHNYYESVFSMSHICRFCPLQNTFDESDDDGV